MGVSSEFGKSVGRFLSGLKNPRWYLNEGIKTATAIVIWDSRKGREIRAWVKAQLHIHDEDKNGRYIKGNHVASALIDDQGNEILNYDGRHYYHDTKTGNFVPID